MKEYEINVQSRSTVYITAENLEEAKDELMSMSMSEIFEEVDIDSVNVYDVEEE